MTERPAVQLMAYDASIVAGVTVLFNCQVIGLDQNALPVRLWTADGQEYTADLIIAADGIKSKIRQIIYPDRAVEPVPTRECILQSQVPLHILKSDDRVTPYLEPNTTHGTLGPSKFSICRATVEGNLAMTSIVMDYGLPSAQGDINASWTMPGDPDELRDMFKAFPVPQRAYLEHASKCTKWRIAIAAEIPKWIGKSSRVILIKPKFTILSIVAEELCRLIHGLRCMFSALRQCYTHKLRYLFKRSTFSFLTPGLDSMYSPFQ
ncbi:FAD-dependent monooxygenase OpS4 [Fusarium oxysporum f. sp. conglutinans]|nr:FAD-dependent monooxygenase OpS4 [Fusarium oxysporum f. sp. conglutinans]